MLRLWLCSCLVSLWLFPLFQSLLQVVCLQKFAALSSCKVSYNRFVKQEKDILFLMIILIKKVLLGTCFSISFVDSIPLRVCRNQRILIRKTDDRDPLNHGKFVENIKGNYVLIKDISDILCLKISL